MRFPLGRSTLNIPKYSPVETIGSHTDSIILNLQRPGVYAFNSIFSGRRDTRPSVQDTHIFTVWTPWSESRSSTEVLFGTLQSTVIAKRWSKKSLRFGRFILVKLIVPVFPWVAVVVCIYWECSTLDNRVTQCHEGTISEIPRDSQLPGDSPLAGQLSGDEDVIVLLSTLTVLKLKPKVCHFCNALLTATGSNLLRGKSSKVDTILTSHVPTETISRDGQ